MIADSDQKSVLLRLHDQIDESRAELSAQEIAEGFKPAIDSLSIAEALDELVRAGLALSVGRAPPRYRISRAGLTRVEQDFEIATTINPSTGLVHRNYSERAATDPVLSNDIDWGKWGSIAGIVGVPLAITLWWFS